MSVVKRIVCLANSRKLAGRCVAGIELTDGGRGLWIRPVSAREHEEVSEYERQYENGSDPRVLDIIKVPLLRPNPSEYQTENWVLDSQYYWECDGRLKPSALTRLQDAPRPLWYSGFSTASGLNDRVPEALARNLDHSLRLIWVEAMTLSVFAPGEAFGKSKRKVQARFQLGREHYRMWVTDPAWEKAYLARSNGEYAVGECHLTVSLGETYDGFAYKLIAAIIPPRRSAET